MELIYILIFAAGFYVGYRVNDYFTRMAVHSMLEDMGITTEQLKQIEKKAIAAAAAEDEDGLPIIEIRIEEHSGVLYAFRKDNDEFLGQGATREALIDRLGEKLRQVKLSIAQADGAAFIGENVHVSYDTNGKRIKSVDILDK
jgi:hypothetical protein